MDYTNILQLGNKLVGELKEYFEDKSLIGSSKESYLLESFQEFISSLSNPIVSENLDNYKLTKQSLIEKLGLVKKIVDWNELGNGALDISRKLANSGVSITPTEIREFLKEYEQAPLLVKLEKSNNSVFDTESQLQILLEDLTELVDSVDLLSQEELKDGKETRTGLKLKVISEIRQLIKDAKDVIKDMKGVEEQKSFNKMVLSVVLKEAGQVTYNKILAEIRKNQALYSGIL
jgi:hypothetical protein